MGRPAPTHASPRPPAAPPYSDPTPISALTRMRAPQWRAALAEGGTQSYAALFPEHTANILHAIEFGAPVDFEGDRSVRRRFPNHPN